jgi:hypothetical protein
MLDRIVERVRQYIFKICPRTIPRSLAGASRLRPWYDWPLGFADCEYKREMWGNQSPIECDSEFQILN